MQLKVCNPHLILSVWTKDVMKCCAAMADASLLKDRGPLGFKALFYSKKKRKKLLLVYMNRGISAKQNIDHQKAFFCSAYLLNKRYITLQPQAKL